MENHTLIVLSKRQCCKGAGGTGSENVNSGETLRHSQSVATSELQLWMSAQAENCVGECFAADSNLSGDQSDETKHGHATVQFFSTLVESPALFGFDDLHAGLCGKGIQATAIFCGDGCTTNHRSG